MEIVENSLDVKLGEFLERPLFCFLATITRDGTPRVSELWFLREDDAVWTIANTEQSYPDRVADNPETALAIVSFGPATGTVQHVGMRGQATIEPHDPERAERLLSRYLSPVSNDSSWLTLHRSFPLMRAVVLERSQRNLQIQSVRTVDSVLLTPRMTKDQ